MYAYFKKLDYFSTECIYSPNAYRGNARTFLKDLEAIRPSAIVGMLSVWLGIAYPSADMLSRHHQIWRGI